jgi:hypothetical protein
MFHSYWKQIKLIIGNSISHKVTNDQHPKIPSKWGLDKAWDKRISSSKYKNRVLLFSKGFVWINAYYTRICVWVISITIGKIKSNFFHISYRFFHKLPYRAYESKLKTTLKHVINSFHKLSQIVSQVLIPADKLK